MTSRPSTTRRPSVVCFEDRCTIIPDGPPIKPRLAKRTLSIPLGRRPPSDFIYDPTFIPASQKCLKIPMWHMSNAPPHATSKGRRMSHNDARPNLKGCLVTGDFFEQGSANDSNDDHIQTSPELMRKISRVRSLDVHIRNEDPMSVLPVRRIEQPRSPQLYTSEPVPLGRITSPISDSAVPLSPVDTSSRPSFFGGMKRPSFLRRRTSSIDRKPGVGSNLTRWTSGGTVSSPGATSNGVLKSPDHHRSTQIPQSISEGVPLVTALEEDELGDLRSDELPVHWNEGSPGSGFITLRSCCKQCQRATDKGLRSDWIPPISRSAQKLLDADSAARHVESRIKTIGEGEDEAEAEFIDPKARKVVVDEVEVLCQRRSSTASSGTFPNQVDDSNTSTSPSETIRPAPGPIWLCSRRSPKSSSGTEPTATTHLGQQDEDYFSSHHEGDVNGATLEVKPRMDKGNERTSEEQNMGEPLCKPKYKTDLLSGPSATSSGGAISAS